MPTAALPLLPFAGMNATTSAGNKSTASGPGSASSYGAAPPGEAASVGSLLASIFLGAGSLAALHCFVLHLQGSKRGAYLLQYHPLSVTVLRPLLPCSVLGANPGRH